MLNKTEAKEYIRREAVKFGFTEAKELEKLFPLGMQFSQPEVEKWLEKMLKASCERPRFKQPERLVNHFALGADPEFIFVGPTGNRTDARYFGMRQGLCVGADNNGRLAEIRPYPSRSALRVTASIWNTLRFMSVMYPKTFEFEWITGAFQQNDGLGGHVHFGRKTAERKAEVRALDMLTKVLFRLDIFPEKECVQRLRGDQRGQVYGALGDFRPQKHGYEYRTLPSWVENPWLTLFILTVAKLVVARTELTSLWKDEGRAKQYIYNLLAYYAPLDDDARLVMQILQRQGLPKHQGRSLKACWNIAQDVAVKNIVVPQSISPTDEDCEILYYSLLDNRPLPCMSPKKTWAPMFLPAGYTQLVQLIDTMGFKGIGELTSRMCTYKDFPINFIAAKFPQRAFLRVGRAWDRYLPLHYAKTLSKIYEAALYSESTPGAPGNIEIDAGLLSHTENHGIFRNLLLSGVFPIWDLDKVRSDSFNKWQEISPKANVVKKVQGSKTLYNSF